MKVINKKLNFHVFLIYKIIFFAAKAFSLMPFMGYYFKNKDYTETNEKLDKLFSDKDTL